MNLPALTNDERIPHDQAVWRVGSCNAAGHIAICVEYEGAVIARTNVGSVPDWASVKRWRFGWPPG